MAGNERAVTAHEAVALLAWFAVDKLWENMHGGEDPRGCCRICCGPCAALYALDQAGDLDMVLSGAPDQFSRADVEDNGVFRRGWMYRAWDSTRPGNVDCPHQMALLRGGTAAPDT